MSVYPSWRYSAHAEPMLVLTAEADAALGAEWFDSPAKCPKPEVKAEAPAAAHEHKKHKAPKVAKA
jgi:hypothetical protein